GNSGALVKVDFRVHGRTTTSLVMGLSAASPYSARNAANDVIVRWVDLDYKRKGITRRITVFDESHEDVFKEAELKRLSMVSSVVAFPTEQEALKTALAA